MKSRTVFLALAVAVSMVCEASAATFRFGFQGDLKSLDSYTLNETFTLGVLGNVYEGLTKRGKNLPTTNMIGAEPKTDSSALSN